VSLNREIRVRISERGAAEMAGNVAVTVTLQKGADGFLADLGEFGGQRVKPLKGQAESLSWTVTIGESQAGEEFTQHLADLEGRMHLLQRLVDVSDRDYGSSDAWRLLATGRLGHVRLNDAIGAWDVEIVDERFVERNTDIWTDAVADPDDPDPTDLSKVSAVRGTAERTLFPWGFKAGWGWFQGGTHARYRVDAVDGNVVTLVIESGPGGADLRHFELRSGVQQLIEDDLLSGVPETVPESPNTSATRGSFRTVCAHFPDEDTNREILAAELVHGDGVGSQVKVGTGPKNRDVFKTLASPVHVVWPTDQPAVDDLLKMFLWAPTHEPTETLAKYTGGHILDAPLQNLFHLAEDIYGAIGLRFEQAAVDRLKDDVGAYPRPFYKITGSERAGSWLERAIYVPGRVAPFLNAAGEVAPKSIALPDADEIPDPSALPSLTPETLDEHPTWEHGIDEQVTAIQFVAPLFRRREITFSVPADLEGGATFEDREFTREHDRIDDLGTNAIKIELPAFAGPDLVDFITRDIFSRYGDGAIRGDAHGLETLEDLDPGDWALIDVPTYPNPEGSKRGGPRVVQVLERAYSLAGVRANTLDAGPELQPLAEPDVSVVKDPNDPSWKLRITVSNLAAGAGYQVEVAKSDVEPGPSSGLWEPAVAGGPNGPTEKSWDPAESDTTYWVRARAVKEGRISSGWSDADSATTDALAAPTNLTVDEDLGCAIRGSVTPGEELRSMQLLVDGEVRATLDRRELEFLVDGLDPATTYDSPGLEAYHLGARGEPGPSVTTPFTTGGADSGPDPGGILVRGQNVQKV
jgi:hypothetical protein